MKLGRRGLFLVEAAGLVLPTLAEAQVTAVPTNGSAEIAESKSTPPNIPSILPSSNASIPSIQDLVASLQSLNPSAPLNAEPIRNNYGINISQPKPVAPSVPSIPYDVPAVPSIQDLVASLQSLNPSAPLNVEPIRNNDSVDISQPKLTGWNMPSIPSSNASVPSIQDLIAGLQTPNLLAPLNVEPIGTDDRANRSQLKKVSPGVASNLSNSNATEPRIKDVAAGFQGVNMSEPLSVRPIGTDGSVDISELKPSGPNVPSILPNSNASAPSIKDLVATLQSLNISSPSNAEPIPIHTNSSIGIPQLKPVSPGVPSILPNSNVSIPSIQDLVGSLQGLNPSVPMNIGPIATNDSVDLTQLKPVSAGVPSVLPNSNPSVPSIKDLAAALQSLNISTPSNVGPIAASAGVDNTLLKATAPASPSVLPNSNASVPRNQSLVASLQSLNLSAPLDGGPVPTDNDVDHSQRKLTSSSISSVPPSSQASMSNIQDLVASLQRYNLSAPLNIGSVSGVLNSSAAVPAIHSSTGIGAESTNPFNLTDVVSQLDLARVLPVPSITPEAQIRAIQDETSSRTNEILHQLQQVLNSSVDQSLLTSSILDASQQNVSKPTGTELLAGRSPASNLNLGDVGVNDLGSGSTPGRPSSDEEAAAGKRTGVQRRLADEGDEASSLYANAVSASLLNNLGNLETVLPGISSLLKTVEQFVPPADFAGLGAVPTATAADSSSQPGQGTSSSAPASSAPIPGLNLNELVGLAGNSASMLNALNSLANLGNSANNIVNGLGSRLESLPALPDVSNLLGASSLGTLGSPSNQGGGSGGQGLDLSAVGGANSISNILSSKPTSSASGQGAENDDLYNGLAEAFITNGYLNDAGQNALISSGFAHEASNYPDLNAVLTGQAPVSNTDGSLTPAVRSALDQMGVRVESVKDLFAYMVGKGFAASASRRRQLDTQETLSNATPNVTEVTEKLKAAISQVFLDRMNLTKGSVSIDPAQKRMLFEQPGARKAVEELKNDVVKMGFENQMAAKEKMSGGGRGLQGYEAYLSGGLYNPPVGVIPGTLLPAATMLAGTPAGPQAGVMAGLQPVPMMARPLIANPQDAMIPQGPLYGMMAEGGRRQMPAPSGIFSPAERPDTQLQADGQAEVLTELAPRVSMTRPWPSASQEIPMDEVKEIQEVEFPKMFMDMSPEIFKNNVAQSTMRLNQEDRRMMRRSPQMSPPGSAVPLGWSDRDFKFGNQQVRNIDRSQDGFLKPRRNDADDRRSRNLRETETDTAATDKSWLDSVFATLASSIAGNDSKGLDVSSDKWKAEMRAQVQAGAVKLAERLEDVAKKLREGLVADELESYVISLQRKFQAGETADASANGSAIPAVQERVDSDVLSSVAGEAARRLLQEAIGNEYVVFWRNPATLATPAYYGEAHLQQLDPGFVLSRLGDYSIPTVPLPGGGNQGFPVGTPAAPAAPATPNNPIIDALSNIGVRRRLEASNDVQSIISQLSRQAEEKSHDGAVFQSVDPNASAMMPISAPLGLTNNTAGPNAIEAATQLSSAIAAAAALQRQQDDADDDDDDDDDDDVATCTGDAGSICAGAVGAITSDDLNSILASLQNGSAQVLQSVGEGGSGMTSLNDLVADLGQSELNLNELVGELIESGIDLNGLAMAIHDGNVDLNAIFDSLAANRIDLSQLLANAKESDADINHAMIALGNSKLDLAKVAKAYLAGNQAAVLSIITASDPSVAMLLKDEDVVKLGAVMAHPPTLPPDAISNSVQSKGTPPQDRLEALISRLHGDLGVHTDTLRSGSTQKRLLKAMDADPKRSVAMVGLIEATSEVGRQLGAEATAPVERRAVSVDFDQRVQFRQSGADAAFVARTENLDVNWKFTEETSLGLPLLVCWDVPHLAETEGDWPSFVVKAVHLEFVNASKRDDGHRQPALHTIDLGFPTAENLFRYFEPGWNRSTVIQRKINRSCTWVPMCAMQEAVSACRTKVGVEGVTARVGLMAERVPADKKIEAPDARIVVRGEARVGVWNYLETEAGKHRPKDEETVDAVTKGTGRFFDVKVAATMNASFPRDPVFALELPKPDGRFDTEGYTVVATAGMEGLRFTFTEEDWKWLPHKDRAAYARIFGQLKGFGDVGMGVGENSGEPEDDMVSPDFNPKVDFPLDIPAFTFTPRVVLEATAMYADRKEPQVIQQCIRTTMPAMANAFDPLAATIFELLAASRGSTTTGIHMKSYLEASPVVALVTPEEGFATLDLSPDLIDSMKLAHWSVNISMAPMDRDPLETVLEGMSEAVLSAEPCASGSADCAVQW